MTQVTGTDAPNNTDQSGEHAGVSAIGTPRAAADSTLHFLVFRGNASEYFRIWIINLVLSIVTLGIYSAWATVRNRRYFYGNTDLDGQRFDFHGEPLAILKGRILAVVVLLAYVFGTEFHWMITLGALAVMAISFPWVLVRALRFRFANTSHRGLRFGFRGSAAEAYRLLGPILRLAHWLLGFTSGLWRMLTWRIQRPSQNWPLLLSSGGLLFVVNLSLLPVLWFRIRNFSMNNSCFGRHGFQAAIRLGVFWKAMAIAFGLGILATIAVAMVGVFLSLMASSIDEGGHQIYIILVTLYSTAVFAYLAPFAAWYCMVNNHVFSNTRLEKLYFNMQLDGVLYWWIMVSNAFAAVLTLGMAIPWAKVRMFRYKLSCLTVSGSLDGFLAALEQDPGAFGDELGQAFDLDFGF